MFIHVNHITNIFLMQLLKPEKKEGSGGKIKEQLLSRIETGRQSDHTVCSILEQLLM